MEPTEFQDSALLYFPVEYLGNPETDYHLTVGYFERLHPSWTFDFMYSNIVTAVSACAHDRELRAYNLVNVLGAAAFGTSSDVPVLKVELANSMSALKVWHDDLAFRLKHFSDNKLWWSSDFPYNPHVTVPLRTALHPPSQFILKPLHFRYRGGGENPV